MSDLISRQAAIDALKEAYWDRNIQSAKDDPCIVDAMTDWAIRKIKGLPSAEPERKKGKWICLQRHHHKCSVCGNFLDFRGVNAGRGDANFCPNCGADMRGEKGR